MNPPHLSNDLLIDLAGGLLTPDEAAQSQAHLQDCPECEARFRDVIKDREAIRARGTPSYQNGRFVRGPAAPRPERSRRTGAMAFLAAAIAVLLVAGVLMRSRPNVEYWLPADFVESVTRSDANQRGLLDAATRAYRTQDARGALRALDATDLTNATLSVQATAVLYRASSLLNLGEARRALDALEGQDVEQYPLPWRTEAMWIVFLAWDELGDPDGVCNALEFLAEEEGDKADLARRQLAQRECP